MDDLGTLVLLAAGVGRRFGGSKQTEGLGPRGEWLLEYTLHDAAGAGWTRAVLVVHPSARERVRDRLAAGAAASMRCELVEQEQPQGTAHALLQARPLVSGPLAVANADDVYGPGSFRALAAAREADPSSWAAVGFELGRTLSPSGPVSRALLSLDGDGFLLDARERRVVSAAPGLVSMNLWAFGPEIFAELDAAWQRHRREGRAGELQLPGIVSALVAEGRARVRVVPTPESWIGLTWPDDRAWAAGRLTARTLAGCYPSPLWSPE